MKDLVTVLALLVIMTLLLIADQGLSIAVGKWITVMLAG